MTDSTTDAIAIAAQIRSGERDARAVVEASIKRIEAIDPKINALVSTRFDQALDEVDRGLPDGPLTGVPILIKDLGADVAGLPTTRGSRLFAEDVRQRDSVLVERYRKAGMVVLGKTNTPELGKNASTEPLLAGPTRNPWRTSHSAGGSSGGSAAAVTSGMVPVAHGSDGGGSIRIPASMGGLFGLKPSRGRVPGAPHTGGLSQPLSVQHALTTTVRDSALLLDIGAEPVAGEPFPHARPEVPYLDVLASRPRALRIAVTTTAADGTPVDPHCADAAMAAARLCEQLGHQVHEAAPSYDALAGVRAAGLLMTVDAAAAVRQRLDELDRTLRDDDLEPFTAALVQHAQAIDGAAVVDALHTGERLGAEIGAFFDDHDLLLTPTIARPVPPLGELDTTSPETMYARAGWFAAFTGIFNLTGQPAMSLPWTPDRDGLPCGVQFVGPMGDEATLLRLAAQIEEAAPWPLHAPY